MIEFKDLPDRTTPINATNLNRVQTDLSTETDTKVNQAKTELQSQITDLQNRMVDTGWIDISSLLKPEFAKWSANAPVKYRKVGKVCELLLLVTPAADFPAQSCLGTVLNLPEEARPSLATKDDIITSNCWGADSDTFMLFINNQGRVEIRKYHKPNENLSPVPAGTWLNGQAVYLTD